MKKILSVFAFATIVGMAFVSCDEPEPFEETVWISSSYDWHLPEYTEWGYNTFGAQYERSNYFISRRSGEISTITWVNNYVVFKLIGYNHKNGNDMTLTIEFPYERIKDYVELVKLDDYVVDLADTAVKVRVDLEDRYSNILLTEVRGELHFKRVQNLFIDNELTHSIVSGMFKVDGYDDADDPFVLKSGRFDLTVNSRNFRCRQ